MDIPMGACCNSKKDWANRMIWAQGLHVSSVVTLTDSVCSGYQSGRKIVRQPKKYSCICAKPSLVALTLAESLRSFFSVILIVSPFTVWFKGPQYTCKFEIHDSSYGPKLQSSICTFMQSCFNKAIPIYIYCWRCGSVELKHLRLLLQSEIILAQLLRKLLNSLCISAKATVTVPVTD